MNEFRHRATTVALGSLTTIVLTTVSAAASPPVNEGTAKPVLTEPVPVSAARILADEPGYDTAAATTVLDGLRLRREHRSLSDALDRQAGIQVQRTAGYGAPTLLRIRGSTAQQVNYAIDDVPVWSIDGAGFDLEDIAVSQLSRAEVYLGMSPAELGANAIGGLVRVVLHGDGPANMAIRLGSGSHGSNLAAASVRWQSPGGPGSVGLRWLRCDGDFPYMWDGGTAFDGSDDQLRRRRNNDLQRLGILLRQSIVNTGKWRMRARYLGAFRDQGLAGIALREASEARLDRQSHDTVLHIRRDDALQRGARLSGHVQAGRLRTEVQDRLGELGPPLHSRQDIDAVTSAWLWRSRPWGPSRLQLRADGRFGQVRTLDRRTDERLPDSKRWRGGLGIMLPTRWASPAVSLLPALSVAGITSERSRPVVTSQVWQTDVHRGRLITTGRIGLHWQATDRAGLQSSWSRGTRLPTLSELFGNDGTVLGNAELNDELADTFDAGLVLRDRARKWRAELQLHGFTSRVRQLIQLQRVTPHQARYLNLGAAELNGLEMVARGRLPGWLHTSVRYGLLMSRDRSALAAYDGKPLPMRPGSRLSSRLTATGRPRPWLGASSAWLAYRWQSGHFADRANRVALPTRASLDVGVATSTADDRLQLTARVDNLLDRHNSDLIGFPLPGRTMMVTLSWEDQR